MVEVHGCLPKHIDSKQSCQTIAFLVASLDVTGYEVDGIITHHIEDSGESSEDWSCDTLV
jgi:hypothetical protein